MEKIYGYKESDMTELAEFLRGRKNETLTKTFEAFAQSSGKAKGTVRNLYYALAKLSASDKRFCDEHLGGKALKVKGLIDTGNALYYKGLPVIIANRDVGENFISPKVKIETYYFDTASGEGKMFLIKTDKIKIFYDGKENIYNNVMLGITKKDVGTGYDVILHPSLSEVKNECVESVEKTS